MKIPDSVKEGVISGIVLGGAIIIIALVTLQTANNDPANTDSFTISLTITYPQ